MQLQQMVGHGEPVMTQGPLPATARTRKILELAALEAKRLRADAVGTDHIVIAMLREVTSTYRINSKGQWSALSHKEKFNSQANSLRQLQPLLPFYCRYYIKAYEKRLLSGEAMPYKIPLKNQIKSTLKKTLALTCGNRSKTQRTHT